ncbi:MAG TPA: methyltransferase [Glycomyces sp.]|nr:methyltransferase [Glycomyces sp.]
MAHHSSHGHRVSVDFGEEIERLRAHAEAASEDYRRLAERLSEPGDRVCVDVGCGAAGMALALAAARPEARVVAVDAEPAVVDLARERARRAGLVVETVVAEVDRPQSLAAAVGSPADLVWARGVVHHVADQQAALDDLASLLAEGGRLAVDEGGLQPQFLPWDLGVGRPGLELRLAEAGSRFREAMRGEHDGRPLPYGWNVALEKAGLTEVRTLSEAVIRPAPLEGADLEAALRSLTAWVGWREDFLDAGDRAAWKALLDADGPHWLGGRRDLHHMEIRSVYVGVKR